MKNDEIEKVERKRKNDKQSYLLKKKQKNTKGNKSARVAIEDKMQRRRLRKQDEFIDDSLLQTQK